MKKTILFLTLVIILIISSCRVNVGSSENRELSEAQQLLIEQSDTSIYFDAIVADDFVLIFKNKELEKAIVVKNINVNNTFALTCSILILGIIIGFIGGLFADKR